MKEQERLHVGLVQLKSTLLDVGVGRYGSVVWETRLRSGELTVAVEGGWVPRMCSNKQSSETRVALDSVERF